MHDPTDLYVVASLVIVATLAVVFAAWRPSSDPTDPGPAIPPPSDRPADLETIAYTNRPGRYGFEYPSTWALEADADRAWIESPDGDIEIFFEPAQPGALTLASDRLVSSLFGSEDPRGALIGTRWERIGGSRSLLVGGITTDVVGRRVRFLAITVRGDPRHYSISVVVPSRSNPARILPIVEQIVSSFNVIEPSAVYELASSRRSDSNRRPAAYKAAALPLSYAGA